MKERNKTTEHQALCEQLNATYKLKNEKYGDSFSRSIEKYGLIAALTRISDKFNRFEQLILARDLGANTDESLKDTLLDMANYCLMTYLEINDETFGEAHVKE